MLTEAAVLACALNLLGRSTTAVPVRFLARPPGGVSPNAEAFRVRNPDTIYLITSAEAFRSAQRGERERGYLAGCRKLASIVVHEEWHVKHGSDEQGAYLAQISALGAMHAESAVITGVRRAMVEVLKREKAQKRPPMIAAK
jgi:hypothetical protein